MEVHCNYSTDQGYYKCTITSICIVDTNTAINSWKGDHAVFKNAGDVTWLHIERQDVKFFPLLIHQKFPNVTCLSIQSCGLTAITRSDLCGLDKLITLDLSRNKLTLLPDDLFADMKNLRFVFINNNKLRFLTSLLLKPIEKTLATVDFTNNVNIDDSFNSQKVAKNDLQGFLACIDRICLSPGKRKDQKIDSFRNMLANFEKLRASEKLLDFTIEVQGKTFKVHKCVLSAQSSVFDNMFSNDAEKATQTFAQIKKINEKDFEAFLNYFYTGHVDSGISPVTMMQLASEFDVPDLKVMCTEKILTDLSELNALEVFNIGHDHEVDELIQLAFKFIKKVFPHIDDDLKEDRVGLNKTVGIGQNLERWN